MWEEAELLKEPELFLTSFAEDEDGELYFVTARGKLFKIGAQTKELP